MHHRSHTRDFILIPVVYFLLGYFVLFLLVFPFRHSISSAVNLLFFNKPNMTEEPVGNIFSTAPEISSGTINLSSIKFPTYGARFGKVKLPSAGIDADLYFGYGQTILIAGHNHTFFHTLGKAKQGDKIQIDTNYGKYIYQVKKTQIRNASDTSAYDLRSKKENLILYTCYPFNELGLTAQRYYVYADMVSGPKIDKQE